MLITLKIINVLRTGLNILTVVFFVDYFKMQNTPTADELPFYAGLLILLVPTIILWCIDLVIYSMWKSRKDIYLTLLANSHYVFFIAIYILGQFLEVNGFFLMPLMFLLLLVGSATNLFQLFKTKKPLTTDTSA